MISFLRGKIIEKTETAATIEVGDAIGISVFLTRNFLAKIEIEDSVEIFCYLSIRENDWSVFGFERSDEKKFFQKLLAVDGVGPKVAMEICQNPIEETKKAILEKNTARLSEIKGLGRKTAGKIILELADKISVEGLNFSGSKNSPVNEEAVLALKNLGFSSRDIFEKLKNLPEQFSTTEEIVRWFLKKWGFAIHHEIFKITWILKVDLFLFLV